MAVQGKWWRGALALMIVVLFAVGCSGEATSDVATDGDTTSETPTTEPAPDETDTADTATAEPTSADSGTDAGDATATEEPAVDASAAATFDDPRGGFFAEFQTGFDRSHPFESLDTFCVAHPPAENRTDSAPGITADSIQIQHMRQQLEDLAAFGFAVDVGDVAAMFEAFVDEINGECGGIRGRMLDLGLSEFTALDPNTQTTACIETTEDRDTVIALNSSGMQGTGPLCVAAPDEGNTLLITTQGLSQDQLDRGGPNLWTIDRVQDDMLAVLANVAHERGLLEGKTIGVVSLDTPGQAEATQSGLVDTLEELGYEVAVVDVIACEGSNFCQGGTPDSVKNMLDAGVDAFFPTLNVTSLPIYLNEMITQGFVPGDITMFTSNFNSMANDLTLSKIVASGSPEAGELVNGLFITDGSDGGIYKLGVNEPEPFNLMCVATVDKQAGLLYAYGDDEDHIKQGMASTVCTLVRMAARALYDAGDNPTLDDVREAMANLGDVDTNYMFPSTFGPDKHSSGDSFQTMTWTYPCELPPAFDEADTCVVPNNDFFLIAPYVG